MSLSCMPVDWQTIHYAREGYISSRCLSVAHGSVRSEIKLKCFTVPAFLHHTNTTVCKCISQRRTVATLYPADLRLLRSFHCTVGWPLWGA